MTSINNILVVCTGNTCRSPMAEYYLKHLSAQEGLELKVWSRGVNLKENSTVATNGVTTLSKEGITAINQHSPQQISEQDVKDANLILVMTQSHKEKLLNINSLAAPKIRLLLSFLGQPNDIPDPFGGDQQEYDACFASMKPAIVAVVQSLKPSSGFSIGEHIEVLRNNGTWVSCQVTAIEKEVYRVDYSGTHKFVPFTVAPKHLRAKRYSVGEVLELKRHNGEWVECKIVEVIGNEQRYKCEYGEMYKFVMFAKAEVTLRPLKKTSKVTTTATATATTTTPATTATSSGYEEDLISFTVKGTNFDIDKKYKPLNVKGTGAYGMVISATDLKGKKTVAIKQIKEWSEDWVDGLRILREIKLLHHFSKYPHPHIVALDNLMASPVNKPFGEVYVVMDYMDTDMHKTIYSSNKFSNEHLQTWMHAALKGLKFLHSGNIIHRDIKPANLLLNKDCHLKICDFGLARGIGEELRKSLTEYVVTRWYRAPELMCSCPYGPKVDIWSLGCIFAELIQRKPLFQGKDYKHQLQLIIQTLGRPSAEDIEAVNNPQAQRFINKVISGMQKETFVPLEKKDGFIGANTDGLDLLKNMLAFNAEKRFTAEQALNHVWVRHLGTSEKDLCPVPPSFAFENEKKLPKNNRGKLREAMWKEIRGYHPELPEERQMVKKKH